MIDRTKFLKFLGLTGFYPARVIIGKKEEKRIYLGDFFIAGFKYYEGEEVINELTEGEELKFKRQKENEYDEKAIEIYSSSGKKLGYIPMDLNFIPANIMDQEIKIAGNISEIDHDAESWEKVIVSIYQIV
ncbi:MAG: HIRAN domain-containing protein [Ignavibacteria bacterium]|nr:HIRAN domain-containing protein [Ignavibacteria bacterium]